MRNWLFILLALLPFVALILGAEWYLREQTDARLDRKLKRNHALRKSMAIHQPSSDSLLIYELRPHSESRQHGVTYRINGQGFRDNEFQPAIKNDVQRILILGDSVAWGWGVEMDMAWPQRLESMAGQGYEVLNMAINGYGTAQEVRILEKYGLDYQPDLIILNYVLNDPEEEDGGLSWYFTNSNRIELWHQARFLYAYLQFWWQQLIATPSAQSSLVTTSPVNKRDHFFLTHEVLFDRVEQAFETLQQITASKQIPVLIVVTPVFTFESQQPYYWQSIHDKIRGLAEQHHFYYLDTAPLFIDKDSKQVSFDPIHPNAAGHEIIAQATLQQVHAIETSSKLPLN